MVGIIARCAADDGATAVSRRSALRVAAAIPYTGDPCRIGFYHPSSTIPGLTFWPTPWSDTACGIS
jgi:hypothetical protein